MGRLGFVVFVVILLTPFMVAGSFGDTVCVMRRGAKGALDLLRGRRFLQVRSVVGFPIIVYFVRRGRRARKSHLAAVWKLSLGTKPSVYKCACCSHLR